MATWRGVSAVAIGVAIVALSASPSVGAPDSKTPKSAKSACADTKDVYVLHMSVGSVLDVDEYVETIRATVRRKGRLLRRAFDEYDRARSQTDYERSLRRLIAWCTQTYGPL